MAEVSSILARAGRFALKHAVAGGVVVGGCAALAGALYFALLLWAIANDGGLGGPLALPGMMAMAGLAALGAVVLVLLPVTVLTEVLCARVARFRWIAEIAVATMVLIAYVFAAVFSGGSARGASPQSLAIGAAIASAVLLVLLGVYWWSSRAMELLLRLATRAWRWVRSVAGASRDHGLE